MARPSANVRPPYIVSRAERHGCAFCVALQRLAVRRRDPVLLEAAIQLREVHASNDAERLAFNRQHAQGGLLT